MPPSGSRSYDASYLDQLFENAQVGIIMAENDGTVIRINPEFQRIFGYSKEECVGKNVDDLVAPGKENQQAAHITHSVSLGNRHSFEAKRKNKDGTVKHVAVMASPIVMDGRQVAVYGFYRDVTEQRQMEAELIKSRQLETIGQLAGGIAHDFNNLLSIILGNIDMGLIDLDSKRSAKNHLELAKKYCMRAHDLTQKFITFSAGSRPNKEKTELAPLLRKEVDKIFDGQSITCLFDVPKDLWPVAIDHDQFRQVLSAIFTNAQEAMPNGGQVMVAAKNITVEECQQNTALQWQQPCVRISFNDSGNGVPAEAMSRLFDPYYSTKRTANRKGLGLGLTVAHSIVTQHGGHIQVESEKNVGTQVHIHLPAYLPVESQD